MQLKTELEARRRMEDRKSVLRKLSPEMRPYGFIGYVQGIVEWERTTPREQIQALKGLVIAYNELKKESQ
jgi:hypothetical protein